MIIISANKDINYLSEKPVERKRTGSSKKPKGGVSIFGDGEEC